MCLCFGWGEVGVEEGGVGRGRGVVGKGSEKGSGKGLEMGVVDVGGGGGD